MNGYLLLFGGLAVLIVAGELLVKGAVGLALKMRISTLVVGMTVVSMGTSAPELVVSLKAALDNHPDIATGNVIGSNIANITLILGITALIFPVAVNKLSVRIDWPMMMLATALFVVLIWNGVLEKWEGILFVAVLLSFMFWLIRKSRKENLGLASEGDDDLEKQSHMPLWKSAIFIVLGGTGLAFGADWLVVGAVEIALDFGIEERVIAITMVAFGTSVPELITSVMASFRRQTDITVGNLIGSNIFNLLGILGITSMVAEVPVSPDMIRGDVPWMVLTSVMILPMMVSGYRVNRLEGLLLVAVYAIYVYLLF